MRIKESLLSRRWLLVGLIGGGLASVAAAVLYPVVRFLL